MDNYIEFCRYTKKLGRNTVLSEINLNIEEGTVIWLKGKNGSGKTMLLRAMSGLILPDNGSVKVAGEELNVKKRFPEDMGILIEHAGFWKNYTAFQTLRVLSEIRKVIGDREIKESLERVGLNPYERKKVGKFSLGMKQKLAIAQAIMEKPQLILLDEPTNSLDHESVEVVRKIIAEENRRGATIIIASHIDEDIKDIYKGTVELDNGKIC